MLVDNKKSNVECHIDEFTLSLSSRNDFNYSEWGCVGLKILKGIANELNLSDFDKFVDTNLQGYNYTERFVCGNGSIRLAFHTDRPNQGILVKFSAAGLRKYTEHIGLHIYDVIRRLRKLKYIDDVHFSRLDFAVDFFNDRRVNLTKLNNDINAGLVGYFNSGNQRNRLKMKIYYAEKEVQSIYFGSRTSNFMLRCYDKKAQQLEIKNPEFYEFARDCGSWTRFEAEIKHDLANKLTDIISECRSDFEVNQKMSSLVLSRFSFKLENGEYHFVSKTFETISNGCDCDVVVKTNNHNQSLEKSKDWYKSDNAGLIGMLFKIRSLYGDEEVKKYLFDLYQCLNEYKPTQSVIDWLQQNKNLKNEK